MGGICFSQGNENTISDFSKFDFKAGEKILFDDQLTDDKIGTSPKHWKHLDGKALVEEKDSSNCIRIIEYYTKITPNLGTLKEIPDNFTIEYDTWLADGYDGNPGIEIILKDIADHQIVITPNKHDLSVSYPNDGTISHENPEEYFGESKFYNRWVHISISYNQKKLVVYLDQYKQIVLEDCRLIPTSFFINGNSSQDMPILLKNFRFATGIPKSTIQLTNGKFVTHGIKFDVNKSVIKPESMSILNELVQYMKTNPSVKFEIGGHTDTDGSDEFNRKLSQQRSDAVKQQLIAMGIDENRLKAKGYGETLSISENTTPEGKANNRRVEFKTIQ